MLPYRLSTTLCLMLFFFCSQAICQNPSILDNQEEIAISFVMKKAFIFNTERETVIDKRVFESSTGHRVVFEAEIAESHSEASELFARIVQKEGIKCENKTDVISNDDRNVGRRRVCRLGSGKDSYLLIYSYKETVFRIIGDDLSSILGLESGFCPRSKTINGKPCTY